MILTSQQSMAILEKIFCMRAKFFPSDWHASTNFGMLDLSPTCVSTHFAELEILNSPHMVNDFWFRSACLIAQNFGEKKCRKSGFVPKNFARQKIVSQKSFFQPLLMVENMTQKHITVNPIPPGGAHCAPPLLFSKVWKIESGRRPVVLSLLILFSYAPFLKKWTRLHA